MEYDFLIMTGQPIIGTFLLERISTIAWAILKAHQFFATYFGKKLIRVN